MSSSQEQLGSKEQRFEPSPELRLHSNQPLLQQPMQPLLQQPMQPLPQPEQLPDRSWHFNAAFVGPVRVGKTKLIQRFVESRFVADGYAKTTETLPVSRAVDIGRHHVLFQCWDTPGADTLTDGLDQRLRFPHVLFIVFDVSRDTVAELESWCRLVDTCGPPRPLLVLVGNKSDLGVHSETLAAARQLTQLEDGLFFVLSILADDENVEVDAMMLEVGKTLTERHSIALRSSAETQVGPHGEAATSDASQAENQRKGLAAGGGKPGGAEGGPLARLKELLATWPCCCPCCY